MTLVGSHGKIVECFDDPNLAWQAWKSDFNAILDHHAPIRHNYACKTIISTMVHTLDKKKMMKEQNYH